MIDLKRFESHSHTQYSNIRGLDALDKENDLIDYAIELGLSGIAITDHETLSSHYNAFKYVEKIKKKAKEELENLKEDSDLNKISNILNFKLGLGNEIYLTRDNLNKENYIKGQDGFWHFILIAKDDIGHKQLRELSSRAWAHYFKQFIERVPTYYGDIEEIVGQNPGHLIASTACLGGQFAKLMLSYDHNKALNFVNWCKSIFGEDFYIEFQPGISEEQILFNKMAYDFCVNNNLKTIITNDVHYLKKEDRLIHKAFLNSNDSEREVDAFYADTYLMPIEDIFDKMNYLPKDFIEKCFNYSLEICNSIEEYSFDKKQIIPKIPLDKDYRITINDDFTEYINNFINSPYLEDRVFIGEILKGLKEKNIYDKKHLDRIEIEVEQIWEISENQGERLSNYFLTMRKVLNIIWESDSIVGPGRGSVFTHLCSYCLDIIQADPLDSPIELPYWRFLSNERPEYPKRYWGIKNR